MKQRDSLPRTAHRIMVTLVLAVCLSIPLVGTLQAQPPKSEPASENRVQGETLYVEPAGVATWQEMLAYEAAHPFAAGAETPVSIPYLAVEPREVPAVGAPSSLAPEVSSPAYSRPLAPPSLGPNFAGLGDNNVSIPPDTMGAAGPNHLMVMLNTQVRIQNKSGGILSTVTLDTFWTGGTGLSGDPYDPRLIYDSLSGRWMATVDVDGQSTTSRVWFALSRTNDPTGTWDFYEFDADGSNLYWADFPDIGTNNTWIAITNNMFTVAAPPSFSGAKMWVIDKGDALTPGDPLTVTVFPRGFDVAGGYRGFTLRPALTFDASESTLYVVDGNAWSSSGVGLLRLSRITGTASSPAWSALLGSTVFPGTGWFSTNLSYNLDQIDADQPGTLFDVNTNDPRLLNAVFRNGRLWTTHSAGRPFSGSPDRTVVAWYELTPSLPNAIVQSGIIDGGSGVHHFFPSIAVNANNDMLLGFSRSSSSLYVQGVFAGRQSSDAAGTVSSIQVCKLGEDSYVKDFGSGRIRWGDYSATVVDPTDNLTFWTLQEYAETDVGHLPNDDRWGTWWCSAQFAPVAYDNLVYLPVVIKD